MITRKFWESLIIYNISTTTNNNPNRLSINNDASKFTQSTYGTPPKAHPLFCTTSFISSLSDANNSGGIVLGTGTTPPTEYDTGLSGSYITTTQASVKTTISYSYNGANEEFSIVRNVQVTNISTSPITINEIGIVALQNLAQYTYLRQLVDHSVLDNPITISPNEIGNIVYEIKIKVPKLV